jgi:hypothetical protein
MFAFDYIRTGFGLMTGFIGPFDTARECTLQFTYTHTHTQTHILVSTVTSSLLLLGSGFQRRMIPFLQVPELFPCLSYQF